MVDGYDRNGGGGHNSGDSHKYNYIDEGNKCDNNNNNS